MVLVALEKQSKTSKSHFNVFGEIITGMQRFFFRSFCCCFFQSEVFCFFLINTYNIWI